MNPTITCRPARLGRLLHARGTVSRSSAGGFSTKTCRPASRQSIAMPGCRRGCIATRTQSTLLALEQLAVVGVDARDAEVAGTAAGARLVESQQATSSPISPPSASSPIAPPVSGGLKTREPEARVEVLRRVAAAADEADAAEAGHAARSYAAGPRLARSERARRSGRAPGRDRGRRRRAPRSRAATPDRARRRRPPR